MIKDSGEIGLMEFDIFKLELSAITSYTNKLINADEQWYIDQLK
jgi:hypothetical protein